MHALHRRSDGSIDMDFYRSKALQERNAYIGNLLPDVSLPSLTPVGRQRLKLFVAAFALATGAFWATMLTTPPQTEAAAPLASINVNDLVIQKNLPMADPADAF